MSILATPVADDFLINLVMALVSHSSHVVMVMMVMAHVVPSIVRVELLVHPIFLGWEVCDGFQRQVLWRDE